MKRKDIREMIEKAMAGAYPARPFDVAIRLYFNELVDAFITREEVAAVSAPAICGVARYQTRLQRALTSLLAQRFASWLATTEPRTAGDPRLSDAILSVVVVGLLTDIDHRVDFVMEFGTGRETVIRYHIDRKLIPFEANPLSGIAERLLLDGDE